MTDARASLRLAVALVIALLAHACTICVVYEATKTWDAGTGADDDGGG